MYVCVPQQPGVGGATGLPACLPGGVSMPLHLPTCHLCPAGCLLPAVLRHLGVIRLSPQLAAALDDDSGADTGGQLPAGLDERALRAAAVTAADAVVVAAAAAAATAASNDDGDDGGGADGACGGAAGQRPFTAHELSCYLLSKVEEKEGGALTFDGVELHPHRTRGTAAY